MTATKLLEVSDLAAQKFQDILKEQDEDEGMLRVMVMPGANGGIQYMLSVEQVAGEDDFVVDTSTIQVLVDMDSAPLLDGSTIDYMEGLMRSGFRHQQPELPGPRRRRMRLRWRRRWWLRMRWRRRRWLRMRRRRRRWWMWLRWALDTTTPQKAESIGRSGMFAPSLLCESC